MKEGMNESMSLGMGQPMDREQYEKDLAERQRKHLEGILGRQGENWRPCLHDACTECHGTGIKAYGGHCVHMISCSCPRCSPYSMYAGPNSSISLT